MEIKMRGGKRLGAGRKQGSLTRKTREVAEKAMASGLTPLDYLLQVMRDPEALAPVRMDAAKAAAPYCHPRLASQTVEVEGAECIEDFLDRL